MQIEYAETAEAQLAEILDYLQERFGNQMAAKAHASITSRVAALEQNPELGRVVRRGEREYRRLVLHPRLIAFYRIEADRIRILALHDTRQQPPDDL